MNGAAWKPLLPPPSHEGGGPGAKFVHNSFTIIFSKPIDKLRKVWYNNNVKGQGTDNQEGR